MSKLFSCLVLCFFSSCVTNHNCDGFESFPEGVERAKELHINYRNLVENEQYEVAFPIWQRLMEYSAAGHIYHFIDGVTIYNYFLERDAKDSAKVVAYKQIIVDLYEQRLSCLSPERGDSGIVMESFAYQLSSMDYEDTDKTLAVFKKAIELNGNKTSAYILAYYADFAVFLFGNDALSKAETRNIYFQLEKIKETNAANTDYSDNWEYVEEYFKSYENYLFDCAYFMEKLKSVYNENPDNPEVFRDVLKTLLINDCDKNDVFVRELIVKDSLYIIKIQHMGCVIYLPDVQGTDLLCKGLEDEAIPYFERALTMDISQQRKASSNYYLARIYHSRGGAANFKIARDYYEAAAKLKPDWGDPYIEIGKMYASSVRSCGNNDGFTMGMIVNTAIDMWNKAKLIDESVATKADNLISKYSTSIPTKEDGFQRGIKEGDAYTVRCWIQRTSTVRLRSQY